MRQIYGAVWLVFLVTAGLVQGDLAGDVVEGIQGAGSCAGCHALLVPLKFLAWWGDYWFVGAITAACKALGVVDPDVCEGAIGQQGPILANDLRSIDPFGQTATKFCDALFGMCQPPPVNEWAVPFPKPGPPSLKVADQSIAFSEQAVFSSSYTSPSPRRQPIQVVHFSDMHIDRHYMPGSDANCSKPICCRDYPDKQGPVLVSAPPLGHHHCDTPPSLAKSMLGTISEDINFSIFTGDVSEASVWLANQESVAENIQTFYQDLEQIMKAPVYPAIGNHESAPTNSFPRNTTTWTNSQWVFDKLSHGWLPFIREDAAAQVTHMSGSYSAVVPNTHLKVISINTVYWYKSNFWLYDSNDLQLDPNGLIAFLVEELQAAEDAGQRVWIIGHMPPGGGDVMLDQSNYFDQVIQRYRNIISGQFYGHTHQDHFSIAYSDYQQRSAETAINVAWMAPAITPRGGNPGFKIYDVDPDTYEIMDARVYRADLDSDSFQTEPNWEIHYSTRQTYAPLIGGWPDDRPLDGAFWHKVTELFERDEEAFQMYLKYRFRGAPLSKPCDAECKRVFICDMRANRAQDNCITSKPGLGFFRRQDPRTNGLTSHRGHGAADICEAGDIGLVLNQLFGSLETSEDFLLFEMALRDAMPDDTTPPPDSGFHL